MPQKIRKMGRVPGSVAAREALRHALVATGS